MSIFGFLVLAAGLFASEGSTPGDLTETYKIRQELLFYQDVENVGLTVSRNGSIYMLKWLSGDYTNAETGFEFAGWLGAYDFENHGLGVYKRQGDGLAGFRVYSVVMRLIQVTSEGCNPPEPCPTDLAGDWNIEITEGNRRVATSTMHLNYREDGDYWDGNEYVDFEDLTGGWGVAADDVLVMGFQHLDSDAVTLKIYSIRGDTLEGRWIEGYYDHESEKTVIESSGSERAIRIPDTE